MVVCAWEQHTCRLEPYCAVMLKLSPWILVGFSPGEIDGKRGGNTEKALDAYLEMHTAAPVPGTAFESHGEHDPLPIGEWAVTAVLRNPVFQYNPDLFLDADPAHSKATIPAGPNGPVGTVWIDISKEHYGLHGSPEPNRIGHSQSHGCVRLTNWDAARLADLVKKGTPVHFVE